MRRKGGRRNEQKANNSRTDEAALREEEARKKLKDLRSLPLNLRFADYDELIRLQRGILKEAISAKRKSETHSRRAKGGYR